MPIDEIVLDDFIITEESSDGEEFEVCPEAPSGPLAPLLVHLKAEYEKTKEILRRESGTLERHSSDLKNNPDVTKMIETEKEIRRYLNMYENELAYQGAMKPMATSKEDQQEGVTMNKKLPIFLSKEYFKFQPSTDSDDSSKSTEETIDENPPTRPRELYLKFTAGNFNYSFPFNNTTTNTSEK